MKAAYAEANLPLVLLGETRSRTYLERMRGLCWGRLWTERTPRQSWPEEPWGFDNGAFGAWKRGDDFPEVAFMRRLMAALAVGWPYLAVVPDVVAGGMESLEFSLRWMERLPKWPWYLAVQDGMKPVDVARHLNGFAGIFLGGTDAFKGTAPAWRGLATENGIRFHYGRAGTPAKIEHAKEVGADSLDSAFPLWEIARFNRAVQIWEHGSSQLRLPM